MVPVHILEGRDSGAHEYYEWQIRHLALPDCQGVVSYFHDISCQVIARETIAKLEARLRFMAESMPQKMFTAMPTGEVDYVNSQWLEFTGLTFDEVK